MKLHKAKTLEEYVAQLKQDVQVLEKHLLKPYNDGVIQDMVNTNFVTEFRDTYENHSHIIDSHRDLLRQLRNKAKTI